MNSKADIVREALATYPGLATADIADMTGTSPAYVRVVRSRQNAVTGQQVAPKHVPVQVKTVVATRDKNRCRDCGGTEKLEYHHVIPRSLGGTNEPGNLALLCPDCHAKETANLPVLASDDEARADAYMMALLDRTIQAISIALDGNPQRVVGSQELIDSIASILDDPQVQNDYPGYAYETGTAGEWEMLTIRSSSDRELIAYAMPRPKGKRKGKARSCQFCSRTPGFTTTGLYKVRGGALGPSLYLLCAGCTEAETRAGASAVPMVISALPGAGVMQVDTPGPGKRVVEALQRMISA